MNDPGYCKNCSEDLEEHHKFCPSCGQRTDRQLPTVGEMIREFLSGLFNFEFQFLPSFGLLFIPGRLSLEFVKGRRKKYLAPVRFFLLSVLALLAVTNFVMRGDLLEIGSEKLREKAFKRMGVEETVAQFDSACVMATKEFPKAMQPTVTDSLKKWMIPPGFQKTEEDVMFSISRLFEVQVNEGDEQEQQSARNRAGITLTELVTLHPDTLIKRSEAQGFWPQIIVRQFARVVQESDRLPAFFAEKTIWMVLLLIPLFAIWLKILYFRSSRYYIEHLVFLFHVHTFGFLFLAAALALSGLAGNDLTSAGIGLPLTTIASGSYILAGMKRFYAQRWTVTILKFFSGVIVYAILSTFIFGLSMAVSFLLF